MKKLLLLLPLCLGVLVYCHSQRNSSPTITTPRNKAVPYVQITSESDIVDDPKRKAQLRIVRNDSLLAESVIGIELRGAMSLQYDKKSYGFELRDAQDKAQELSLLGMPADEDWILHGPYSDRSLIRNALVYSLSNQMGRYAARWQFVELEINGDYKGLYLLMEKLKRSPERINVAKLEADQTTDLTGGYILKLDKTAGASDNWSDYTEQNSVHSGYDQRGRPSADSRIHYLFEYPKATKISAPQKNYLRTYLNNFEQSMASPQYRDSTAGYGQWIDVDSFVDYFILTEFMQNNDGYRISTFMQKDRNGKLAMGPIWDCDLAFGPDQVFCGGMQRDAWVYRYNQYCGNDDWLVPFWWERLLQDPAFKAKVQARWQSLRQNVLSEANVTQTIDQLAGYLQQNGLIDRNYERWSEPKRESYQSRYQKHISSLKTWTQRHSRWIDGQILKL